MSLPQLENKPSGKVSLDDEYPTMKPPNSHKFPFRLQKTPSPRNDSYVVTNLMAELAIALNMKIKLENENSHLKLECDRLTKNQMTLERKIIDEKSKCSTALYNLQELLSNKDIEIKRQSANILEESKSYISQISDLKEEINKIKEEHTSTITDMQGKMNQLEEQLTMSKRVNDDLLERVDMLKDKTVKYRNKCKFAVSLLQKMNQVLQYFYHKRTTLSKKCQTESIIYPPVCSRPEPIKPITKSQENFSHDNIISELFFKPNPFTDNIETLFFTHQDFQKNQFSTNG